MKTKLALKIDIENSVPPKGYAFTGEYRLIQAGEFFFGVNGEAVCASFASFGEWPVLVKVGKRANFGGDYFVVNTMGRVMHDIDHRTTTDDQRYAYGNYFLNKEDAEKVKEKIDKIFSQV